MRLFHWWLVHMLHTIHHPHHKVHIIRHRGEWDSTHA